MSALGRFGTQVLRSERRGSFGPKITGDAGRAGVRAGLDLGGGVGVEDGVEEAGKATVDVLLA